MVAWVLTRDDFVGKRLVDAVIDLPFALPTIVASLVMLALCCPGWGWSIASAAHRGIGVALLFVTLPFVVRSVQPVLLELDRRNRRGGRVTRRQQLRDLHQGRAAGTAAVTAVGCGLAFSRPSANSVRWC